MRAAPTDGPDENPTIPAATAVPVPIDAAAPEEESSTDVAAASTADEGLATDGQVSTAAAVVEEGSGSLSGWVWLLLVVVLIL